MSDKYLIVADDFTGSNDTGVQLSKNGIKTDVILYPRDKSIDHSVVLDTESRTIPAQEAFNKVKRLTKIVLANNEFQIVYKKVDSTIRGNIAEELDALMQIYHPDRVVVAPAFPATGRTTKNSIQFLNGIRLMHTEIAKDPLNPIWTDDISQILVKRFGNQVAAYHTEELNSHLQLKNKIFHVFDIETENQMQTLADFCKGLSGKTLFVGSAGLATYLFHRPEKTEPVLSVVGSLSEVSLKQMQFASEKGVKIVQIPTSELAQKDIITTTSNTIQKLLSKNKDVILTASLGRDDYQQTLAEYKKIGITDKAKVSNSIKNLLAKVTLDVLKHQLLAGLFLTGGDTATEIIRQAKATGCQIRKEITTGVVLSQLTSGDFDKLPVVTKAGAFGEKNTICESIRVLKEESK